jgi:ankyrin repeat protein
MRQGLLAVTIVTANLALSCGPSEEVRQDLTNRLFKEIEFCNLPSVREQVRLGADVNGHYSTGKPLADVLTGYDDMTPLMYAAVKGEFDCVAFLLDEDAMPDDKTKEGFTPIMYAAMQPDSRIVEILLEKGVYIDMRDLREGGTALITAASRGHTDVVRTLLKRGARIEIETEEPGEGRRSALSEAICGGHLDTAKVLVAAGAPIDTDSVKGCLEEVRSKLRAVYPEAPERREFEAMLSIVGKKEDA